MLESSVDSGETAVCSECGGRGWIVEPDGGNGTARRCGCAEEQRLPRLFGAAGIPLRYRGCRLSSFTLPGQRVGTRDQLLRALRESERYVEEFLTPEGTFRESGLIFVGPPGVGKTHLAVGVLWELIRRYRVRGRFAEFTALLQQIQATFDPDVPESKQEILDPLLDAEVLVLDELGAQNPTPWMREMLYVIVNHRYVRRRPTLFTTNYRIEARSSTPAGAAGPRSLDRGPDAPATPESTMLLASRLPAPLVSRICEMAKPIDLTSATDYRLDVLMHGHHA